MSKKRPKASTSDQLNKLLKTYALRRLEHGSPDRPSPAPTAGRRPDKPKKAKRSKKR